MGMESSYFKRGRGRHGSSQAMDSVLELDLNRQKSQYGDFPEPQAVL